MPDNRELMAEGFDVVDVLIENGESLSEAIALYGLRIVGIMMPALWTAAGITFQGSPDGQTFYNVYDSDGNEVEFSAAQARFITVFSAYTAGFPFCKVRSGNAGTPVAQGADRTLKLIVAKVY
jgi:hypothetical protein